jgi:hypothetical protein
MQRPSLRAHRVEQAAAVYDPPGLVVDEHANIGLGQQRELQA